MKPVSNELKQMHMEFTKKFYNDTLDLCKKENRNASDIINIMNAQIQMCQVLLFSLMAAMRSDSAVATIYADMKELSMSAIEMIIKHPEVLLQDPNGSKKEPMASTLATIELFKEIRDAKSKLH